MAVVFSKPAAKRISAAVRKVEAAGTRGVGWYPYRGRGGGASLVICKTTADWAKGTKATLTVYSGDPLVATGGTISATNIFADVKSGKWCGVLDGYLISAECD